MNKQTLTSVLDKYYLNSTVESVKWVIKDKTITVDFITPMKNLVGKVIERPQHMYMRVALWVTNNITDAFEYYKSLSEQLISKATPIMINAGTKVPQLASCVLHYNNSDSREGLLNTMSDISTYSSDAAGIGLSMSNIRSKESRISSSGGYAGGLLKYLKIVNESLRFFNQQGRRPGSAAIYIESISSVTISRY